MRIIRLLFALCPLLCLSCKQDGRRFPLPGPVQPPPFEQADTSLQGNSNQLEYLFDPYLQSLMHGLYLAAEDGRVKEPRVVVNPLPEYVAFNQPRQSRIVIEEKALQVCRSFGPDSASLMAFIMGHEFAHLVQRTDASHHAPATFGYYRKGPESAEGNADMYSLLLCRMAGFTRVQEQLPDFIERLYQAYRFDEKLESYPPKRVRQSYARLIGMRTDTLLQIWDAGMFLLALQQYEAAEACFEYVKNYFPGAEVWHNLGTAAALTAAQWMRQIKPLQSHYPFLPEARIRLEYFRSPTERLEASIEAELAIAREAFNICLRQRPASSTTLFNRILLHLLEGEKDAARNLLNRQTGRMSKAQSAFVQTALQTPTAGLPERESLEGMRRLALVTDPVISASARLNIAIWDGQPQDYAQRPCPPPPFYPDDLKPEDLRFAATAFLALSSRFRLAWRRLPNSILLRFQPANRPETPIFLHVVCSPCPHPFNEVKDIGSRWKPTAAASIRQSNAHSFWQLGPCLPAVKTDGRERIESWAYVLPEGF